MNDFSKLDAQNEMSRLAQMTTEELNQMKQKKEWSVSDISNPIKMRSDILEFQDDSGEWHDFTIIATEKRIVFGGVCNVGFIESGFIERDETESLDETLQELLSDLETYYNDGPEYTSRIVVNERM